MLNERDHHLAPDKLPSLHKAGTSFSELQGSKTQSVLSSDMHADCRLQACCNLLPTATGLLYARSIHQDCCRAAFKTQKPGAFSDKHKQPLGLMMRKVCLKKHVRPCGRSNEVLKKNLPA
jgi:hypothetical protein